MISQLLITLLAGQGVDECPAKLVLHGAGISRRAQSYADCVSQPSLPTTADLAAKKRQCAVKQDRSKGKATAWVDNIAKNFPGCETRLEFK
ncbi:MAG TPA: hypothetical protein VF485_02090 [Sphingomonas sp.]